MVLAEVAHLQALLDHRLAAVALARERAHGALPQRLQRAVEHLAAVRVARVHEQRGGQVRAQPRGQQAERRGVARVRRHEHLADAEDLGDAGGVERAGASEGDEREVARIDALLDRDHAERVHHVVVGELHDGVGGLLDRPPERLGHLLERGARAAHVEHDVAAGEVLRVEPSEQQVRVGQRRPLSAHRVARGAGARAGALGADAQQSARVDPRDRSAAGADRADVDHRGADRDAELELEALRSLELPVVHQRDVARRAADVDRHDLLDARERREVGTAEHAAHRPRDQVVDRLLGRGPDVDDAPVGLHHQQLRRRAGALEPGAQVLHVAGEHRLQVRVRDRGVAAVVLAPARIDLMGERDGQLRDGAAQAVGQLELMGRVQVGEEERHRDGRDALVAQVRDDPLHVVRVQRPDLLALVRHAAVDLEAVVTRGERTRLAPPEAVEVPAVGVLDEDDVPEAAVGDEGDAGARALDQRVGGDGGAVDEEVDVLGGDLRLVDDAQDGGDRVVGHARRLLEVDVPGALVDCHQIGERATDVYGHVERHPRYGLQ